MLCYNEITKAAETAKQPQGETFAAVFVFDTAGNILKAVFIKIDYTNKKQFNDIYLHDAEFVGFTYAYDDREIRFECIDYWLKKKHSFCFSNVLFFEMQGCQFQGASSRIYTNYVEENPEQLQKLLEMQREDEAKSEEQGSHSFSLLADGTNFISVGIQLIAGDTLLIICESIQWEETELSESALEDDA